MFYWFLLEALRIKQESSRNSCKGDPGRMSLSFLIDIGSARSAPVFETRDVCITKPDHVRNPLPLPCQITRVGDSRPSFCLHRHHTDLNALTCVKDLASPYEASLKF